MIDTSSIALDDLIERETGIRLGKKRGTSPEKVTRKGPCPWCKDGTDRFAVFVDAEKPHFYCGIHGGAGCHASGDAIDFMALWHKITKYEAAQRLGLSLPEYQGGYAPMAKRVAKIEVDLDSAPADTWAMAALVFARISQQVLWSDKGRAALDWLKQRGFSEETIRLRGYGYNPVEQFIDIAEWGVTEGQKVWLPRGIVIPWMIAGTIWKVSIRRNNADLKRDEAEGKTIRKYVSVKGGSNGLYRADEIQPGQPLVIVEGELNADILSQALAEAGRPAIAVVATGSTGKGRADNWLVKIAKASPILFSFDPDKGGAQAVQDHWKKVLPDGLPWDAIGGDLNEMYLAGKDVGKWLHKGLKIARLSLPTSAAPESVLLSSEQQEVHNAIQDEDEMLRALLAEALPPLCDQCVNENRETEAIGQGPEGGYCEKHRPGRAHIDPLHDPVVLHILSNPGIPQPVSLEVIPVDQLAAFKERTIEESREKIRRRAAEVQEILSFIFDQAHKTKVRKKEAII